MRKKTLVFLIIFCLFLVACDSKSPKSTTVSESKNDFAFHEDHTDTSDSRPKASDPDSSGASDATTSTSGNSQRDPTATVLVPVADGSVTYGNTLTTIDASHSDEGYVMVNYTGSNSKVKLQITGPDQVTYTYNLHGPDYEVFPLTAGNGSYTISVYENIHNTEYASAYSTSIEISLKNAFGPYLYPNQYVNFDASMQTVKRSEELAKGATNDLDVVSKVYNYLIDNITYDYTKASSVQSGYLPVVDDVLEKRTGICFDYAAVMATMLRVQKIPTRLEVGYAKENYHAWISTYITDIGWINGVIEFDGANWHLMDPTFAASDSSQETIDFITDSDNYTTKYVY